MQFPWWLKHYYGEYVNSNAIKLMKKNIDILIFPSVVYENFPTVINEAFAANIPVIGVNNGGVTEMIKDNENGLLFENSNLDDLKNKIETIDQKLIKKLKNNLKTQNIYDFNQHTKDILNIYKSLIKQAKVI